MTTVPPAAFSAAASGLASPALSLNGAASPSLMSPVPSPLPSPGSRPRLKRARQRKFSPVDELSEQKVVQRQRDRERKRLARRRWEDEAHALSLRICEASEQELVAIAYDAARSREVQSRLQKYYAQQYERIAPHLPAPSQTGNVSF